MQRGAQIAAASSAIIALAIAAGQFIEPHEGRILRTYSDPVGVNTACVGNTSVAIPGATFSDEECSVLLLADTIIALVAVRKLVKVELDDELAISLTSFVYNLGWRAFRDSTLLAKLNAGDRIGAAAELKRWVHGGGRVLPGLVIRRAQEARLIINKTSALSPRSSVSPLGQVQVLLQLPMRTMAECTAWLDDPTPVLVHGAQIVGGQCVDKPTAPAGKPV